MSDPSFSEVEACVFDAYEPCSTFIRQLRMKDDLGEKADALSDMWHSSNCITRLRSGWVGMRVSGKLRDTPWIIRCVRSTWKTTACARN